MIQVKSIEFTRVEGATGQVGQPILFAGSDAWERINAYVAVAAKSAPAPLAYDKCDVTIVWEDGARYTFRFDMSRNHASSTVSLSAYLNNILNYEAAVVHGPASYEARKLRDGSYDLGLDRKTGPASRIEPQPASALRPAADLAHEDDEKRAKRQDKTFEAGLARAATAINRAHAAGERSVTDMTFSNYVVMRLRGAGYTVRRNTACGMGDVDTHTIEW